MALGRITAGGGGCAFDLDSLPSNFPTSIGEDTPNKFDSTRIINTAFSEKYIVFIRNVYNSSSKYKIDVHSVEEVRKKRAISDETLLSGRYGSDEEFSFLYNINNLELFIYNDFIVLVLPNSNERRIKVYDVSLNFISELVVLESKVIFGSEVAYYRTNSFIVPSKKHDADDKNRIWVYYGGESSFISGANYKRILHLCVVSYLINENGSITKDLEISRKYDVGTQRFVLQTNIKKLNSEATYLKIANKYGRFFPKIAIQKVEDSYCIKVAHAFRTTIACLDSYILNSSNLFGYGFSLGVYDSYISDGVAIEVDCSDTANVLYFGAPIQGASTSNIASHLSGYGFSGYLYFPHYLSSSHNDGSWFIHNMSSRLSVFINNHIFSPDYRILKKKVFLKEIPSKVTSLNFLKDQNFKDDIYTMDGFNGGGMTSMPILAYGEGYNLASIYKYSPRNTITIDDDNIHQNHLLAAYSGVIYDVDDEVEIHLFIDYRFKFMRRSTISGHEHDRYKDIYILMVNKNTGEILNTRRYSTTLYYDNRIQDQYGVYHDKTKLHFSKPIYAVDNKLDMFMQGGFIYFI